MLAKKKSLRYIAKKLGRHHTTLSRELDRNAKYGRKYIPCVADKFAVRKALRQRFRAALKSPLVFVYVREKLRLGWSPEIISGRIEKDHPGQSINTETIYKYIYSKKAKRDKLFKYLELGRKKRREKTGRKVQRVSRIKGATSIDLRPKSVDKRVTSGHWETDNMEGVKTDKHVLSATIERVTRVTLLTKLKNRKSITKVKAVIARIDEYPDAVKLSLTADNGPENTRHKLITNKLGIPVYFCHAYHSWEKGSVENRIKKVRRVLPKGESLDTISEEKIEQIEHWLNSTPMKCLDYLTPYEKMQEVLVKLNSNSNLVSGALQERM
ncbi:IS30 family transposase [Patescibacteria group bacterium]|nr:IS30 family transposase [Patescibacteria group bacterium]